MKNKVGILYSMIRDEEQRLFKEAERYGLELVPLRDSNFSFSVGNKVPMDISLLLGRSISFFKSLSMHRLFESNNVPAVNSSEAILNCGNKLFTSALLSENRLPMPPLKVAFSVESAMSAIEEMGYPVVLKPVIGSWGRLCSRVENRETALTILEHKKSLASPYHSVFYIQKYIEHERDIRVFMAGSEIICAIYRTSDFWITNVARGAAVSECPVTEEMYALCRETSKAVKAEIVGIDLLEEKNRGRLLVNEINAVPEFKTTTRVLNINIAEAIIQYIRRKVDSLR